MRAFPSPVALAGAILGMLVATGCIHHHHREIHHEPVVSRGGPPPWAPAHGYRHKHAHGVDLVFDSHLGVYVVVGLDDHYFHGDHYYRLHTGGWQWSVHLDGPWVLAPVKKLPPGLAKKHIKKKHAGPSHRKGHAKR